MDSALDFLPLCDAVGRSFARSYPPVQAEDISQELALFLVERLGDLLEKVRDPEAREGYVRKALTRRATRYCQAERADLLRFTDQYSYRPDDVRSALASFLASERPRLPADYVQGAPPPASLNNKRRLRGEYLGNDLALLVDLKDGWGRLGEPERIILRDYLTRDVPGESAERNRAARAVERLTALMNNAGGTAREGPGSRRHIDTEEAAELVQLDYDGLPASW